MGDGQNRTRTSEPVAVVVYVGRQGADFELHSALGSRPAGTVLGQQWPLHRTSSADWSERHFQLTVENTWEHNAAEIAEALGPRDLDTLTAFAEFLKARRAARSFAQHHQFETPHHDEDVGPASHESHTSVTSDAELSHASSKDGPESAMKGWR